MQIVISYHGTQLGLIVRTWYLIRDIREPWDDASSLLPDAFNWRGHQVQGPVLQGDGDDGVDADVQELIRGLFDHILTWITIKSHSKAIPSGIIWQVAFLPIIDIGYVIVLLFYDCPIIFEIECKFSKNCIWFGPWLFTFKLHVFFMAFSFQQNTSNVLLYSRNMEKLRLM